MFLIPQMLTDETLRARFSADIQKVSVLSPHSPAAKELQVEIAALAAEHRRRGLPLDSEAPQDPPAKPKRTRKKSV